MSGANPKQCDNKSVGVIIRNAEGAYALLKRARFPVGIAPVAGHIDEHGSVEQAAVDEINEEVGLVVAIADLQPTAIASTRFKNQCRRPRGSYHDWWVFEVVRFNGELRPDPDETKGAAWYKPSELQLLADRTRQYQAQQITQQEWETDPGLEEIWLIMLEQLGHIH